MWGNLLLCTSVQTSKWGGKRTNTLKEVCMLHICARYGLLNLQKYVLSSPGFISLSFKVCTDPEWVVWSRCLSQKDTRKLNPLVVPTLPSTLNTAWIGVCLGGVKKPSALEETWKCLCDVLVPGCCGILSQDFNKPYYNNQSSKPVCAAAAGCESWVLQLVTWCLAAENLSGDSCVLQLFFETWKTNKCRQLWDGV